MTTIYNDMFRIFGNELGNIRAVKHKQYDEITHHFVSDIIALLTEQQRNYDPESTHILEKLPPSDFGLNMIAEYITNIFCDHIDQWPIFSTKLKDRFDQWAIPMMEQTIIEHFSHRLVYSDLEPYMSNKSCRNATITTLQKPLYEDYYVVLDNDGNHDYGGFLAKILWVIDRMECGSRASDNPRYFSIKWKKLISGILKRSEQ